MAQFSSLKESLHVGERDVWLVLYHGMSRILHCEDLRSARLEMHVALDELFRSTIRREKVLISVDGTDWELNLWVTQTIFSCHGMSKETRPLDDLGHGIL